MKADFQSRPILINLTMASMGWGCSPTGQPEERKRVQHHAAMTVPFSENFSMASGSCILEQNVIEAILLLTGRKGTPCIGLWFIVQISIVVSQ